MVAALIKFTQGATTDVAGRALVGAAGTNVVVSNGDDTGVVSWTYDLLYVPPGSALVVHTQGPSIVSTFGMGVPDVFGCYRVRLTVVDANGNTDQDIRNFAIVTTNRHWIIPPYQGNPVPLPLVGVGSKPDELNFGDQAFGWQGDGNTARKLAYLMISDLDALL